MDDKEPRSGPVYGVWADQSTLKRESLGPLFMRISIGLRGPVNETWRRSFHSVRQENEQQFSRYVIDSQESRIAFTFRSNESPDEVHILIQRLGLLIELANLHATAAAAVEVPRRTGA